jgi:hypothetical protein
VKWANILRMLLSEQAAGRARVSSIRLQISPLRCPGFPFEFGDTLRESPFPLVPGRSARRKPEGAVFGREDAASADAPKCLFELSG